MPDNSIPSSENKEEFPWDDNIPDPEYTDPIDNESEKKKNKKSKKTVIDTQPDDEKNQKEEKKFPSNSVWASSEGDLLDKEFHRLLEVKNLTLQDALLEINRKESYLEYWNEFDKKPFKLSDRSIRNSYDRHFKKQRKSAFDHVKSLTQYDGNSSVIDVVSKLQSILSPVLVNPKHAEPVAYGLAHWMWQVLRRAHGLDVENHIVIIFINEGNNEDGQGSGKTTFVKNICKLFTNEAKHKFEEHLFADTDLDTLSDKRAWADILGRLIAFLDDICPENRQQVATLKSIFTCGGSKAARGCYEKGLTSTKVLVSAIGTCNSENFGQVIKDVSGNRRYLPVHVKSFKGKIHKNIDMIPIWKMIDPSWECFIDLKMFREIQKEHTTQGNVDLLLDMYGIEPWKDAASSGECFHIYPRDMKILLNKYFSKEKSFSTQSLTTSLKAKGFLFTDKGGPRKKDLVYFLKFSGNGFDRWQQNFSERSSDNPDRRPSA